LYDMKMKIAAIFLLNAGIVALVGLLMIIFMKKAARSLVRIS